MQALALNVEVLNADDQPIDLTYDEEESNSAQELGFNIGSRPDRQNSDAPASDQMRY